MPKPVAVLGWAIVRFQSRSGLWTSWPGGGGVERVWRRQFVIKSQVHGHEQKKNYMYTNIREDGYPVFHSCALAVQWYSIQMVCRRLLVQFRFATFLNPVISGLYWFVLVCTGMYWYVPILYQYELVHTCTYFILG